MAGRAEAVPGVAGRRAVSLTLEVPEPQLWHFDQPSLYRWWSRLRDASAPLSTALEETFGIRTVEIRDRGLWLNGERVRLTGMTRHEDSPQEGLAETRGTMKADWDDLKSLQVVLTRPVHYPQHPFILDYADRNGVLLVPEIPMWQFSEEQMKDPRVLALAKGMMQEMIEQAANHPSIFAWSVCNESATSTPGGRAYVEAMVEHVKALDPGRYVTYADDGLPWITEASQNANQHTDFIMMNQYFGSWAGPAEGLAPRPGAGGDDVPGQDGRDLGVRPRGPLRAGHRAGRSDARSGSWRASSPSSRSTTSSPGRSSGATRTTSRTGTSGPA